MWWFLVALSHWEITLTVLVVIACTIWWWRKRKR